MTQTWYTTESVEVHRSAFSRIAKPYLGAALCGGSLAKVERGITVSNLAIAR